MIDIRDIYKSFGGTPVIKGATLDVNEGETLEEIGRVQVFDNQGPVVRLNELEYIGGEVFANVWQTDWVARIDPDTGQVVGWVQGQLLTQRLHIVHARKSSSTQCCRSSSVTGFSIPTSRLKRSKEPGGARP